MSDAFEPQLRHRLRARAERTGRPDNPAADVRRRVRRQDTVQRSLAAVGALVVLAVAGVAGLPLLGGGGVVLDSSPPASEPGEGSGRAALDPGEEPGAAQVEEPGEGPQEAEGEAAAGDGAGECSAAGSDPDLEAQPGVPDPVAETRARLLRAAVACDYEALADVPAAPGGPTYSFGSDDDAIAYWRRAEAEGGEPLRALVEVLGMPHATRDGAGSDIVVWPSAFAYEHWADVPTEDREALRPLYGERDFDSFSQFGGYMGYRVGIRADGTWMYFVAGD